MRPYILKVKSSPSNNFYDIILLGGLESRNSLKYYTREHRWAWLPALPNGHQITNSLSVCWNDKVIFTFVVDGNMTLKSAACELTEKNESAHAND